MSCENELSAFAQRIRRASAWKGAAVGLFFGSIVALILAGADSLRWVWVEWPLLLACPIIGVIAGALWGFFRSQSLRRVAASVDRRGKLRDRALSSLELQSSTHPFVEEVHTDARNALANVDPKRLYPLGFMRWHLFAGVAAALTVFLVLLGNTPIFDSPQAKKDREEMKKQAEQIERVVKPALRDSNLSKPSAEYARDLQRYARELERARMDRKEALKKANKLASKGEDVEKQLSNQLNKKLYTAQKSLEAMLTEQLKKDGTEATSDEVRAQLENMLHSPTPEYDRAMEQLTQNRSDLNAARKDLQSRMDDLKQQLANEGLGRSERAALEQLLQNLDEEMKGLDKQMQELMSEMARLNETFRNNMGVNSDDPAIQEEMRKLQKQLAELAKKLAKPNLTDAQKKALEEKMKALQEALSQLKFSDELREGMRKLMNDPKMKAILQRYGELLKKAKLAEGDGSGEAGEPPKITKEDIAEMQKAIDELAKKLQDDDFRKQLLDQLKEALDSMDELVLQQGMCSGFCFGMGMLPGLPTPIGSALHGGAFSDTNWVNKFEKGVPGEGKTLPMRAIGERHPTLGKESFIEVRGPAKLTGPSKIPYLKILPKYQQAAEEAMRKQKIPKDQEKRVRDYFRSISGQ